MAGEITGHSGGEGEQAHGVARCRDVKQHPLDVGMTGDRPRIGRADAALTALRSECCRLLQCPLADRDTLQADRDPGRVHHAEHRRHAVVQRADQLADGVVELQHARRAGVDAHLVLEGEGVHAVATP